MSISSKTIKVKLYAPKKKAWMKLWNQAKAENNGPISTKYKVVNLVAKSAKLL